MLKTHPDSRPPSSAKEGKPVFRQTFELEPTPPFRLDLTVWTLRRRASNVVDRWDGETYRRVLVVGDSALEVAVRQHGTAAAPRLELELSSPEKPDDTATSQAVTTIRRTLGLDIDLSPFYQLVMEDEHLAPLAMRFAGFRPPRYPTLFEALVNAVSCQQITLNLGLRLLNDLAALAGVPFQEEGRLEHSFPTPQRLAALSTETLRSLGFSGQKVRTLKELAERTLADELAFEALEGLEDDALQAHLRQWRGIGPWSADYALLRGFGRLDVFPFGDSGARNGLSRWLGLDETPDYKGVQHIVSRWTPYSGLVYFHLLLEGLAERGVVAP
jgi:DNA-3-methyladenine glycosylase II